MIFVVIILLALAAAFTWRAVSRGKFGVSSRRDALFEIAETVVIMVLAWAVAPWATSTLWAWLLAVLLIAAGVFAIVLRWASLPWTKPGKSPVWMWIWTAVRVIFLAVLVVLVVG